MPALKLLKSTKEKNHNLVYYYQYEFLVTKLTSTLTDTPTMLP